MVCLDTSFIIDLLRGEEKAKDIKNELNKKNELITITSPSIIELITGANLSSASEKEKEKINEFLSFTTIFNLDRTSSFLAGDIEANLIKKGKKIEIEDIMIAAITINNNETLLTRNKKHFSRIQNLKIRSY